MKIMRFFHLNLLFGIIIFFHGCKAPLPSILVANQQELMISEDTVATNEVKILDSTRTKKRKPPLSLKSYAMQRDVENLLNESAVFSSHFTGFSLFDMSHNEFIVNYNADKYFTPASNVKVLTLYAALKSFGQKLPGLMYRETADTLYLRPIGDPTFLHPHFSDQPVIKKIKNSQKSIALEWPDIDLAHFGIGWMWDDYLSRFQPELNWMPIYGNVVHFDYSNATLVATPALFKSRVKVTRGTGKFNTIRRELDDNYFSAEIRYKKWAFEKDIPFKCSKKLVKKLLRDAIQMPVTLISERNLKMDTLFSQPTDTVLQRMMQTSDNFIAEQLLIMSAWKNGFNDTQTFREYMATTWLADDIKPVWVDGSGLSRYNLIRPVDEVRLLNKLYYEFDWMRIRNLFSHGGKSGTIKNWYPNSSDSSDSNYRVEPYIIAKTGTLSNNHTLSGYLQTRSGRLLTFSLMNNNYVRKTSEVKKAMQQLLEMIRDSY